jgi:hypothetical protein
LWQCLMKINSDNPPKTVSGMWDAIVEYAEHDEFTRNIIVTANNEGLDAPQTLVCLAYAALCSRETSDECLKDIQESVGLGRGWDERSES